MMAKVGGYLETRVDLISSTQLKLSIIFGDRQNCCSELELITAASIHDFQKRYSAVPANWFPDHGPKHSQTYLARDRFAQFKNRS